jgi:hypothetical protein
MSRPLHRLLAWTFLITVGLAVVGVHAEAGRRTAEVTALVGANASFRQLTFTRSADGSATMSGEARVFEGGFAWRLESGGQVLRRGHGQAAGGAPAWARFRLALGRLPTGRALTLVLYERSPKDGAPVHVLKVRLPH